MKIHITKNMIPLVLFFTCASQGCMTTGSNFPSDISWVKKEQTKQADVSRVLGKPYSVGSSGNIPTWTFAYYTYNIFKGNFYKELKLYWNGNKTLKHYSFSSSFPEDVKLSAVLPGSEAPKDMDFE